MGGEFWIESEVGKGSAFYFTAEFGLNDNIVNINQESDKGIENLSKESKREIQEVVLYAEDNEITQRIVKVFLESKEVKCICAINGKETVSILGKERIDLILMDTQMPVLNGLETAHLIRSCEFDGSKRIPIIEIISYSIQEDKEKCLSVEIDDYISKPFDLNELYIKIRRLLQ